MALSDLFTSQTLNQVMPSRLPGTAKGWDTSSMNREVCLDKDVSVATRILPSCAVKLSGEIGQMKCVEPCTSGSDKVYGFVIYKAKNYINEVGRHRMMTVAREGQEMDFAFKSSITAGEVAYWDPTDGLATSTATNNIKIGLAVETVSSASSSAPVIATVEIQAIEAMVEASGTSYTKDEADGKFATKEEVAVILPEKPTDETKSYTLQYVSDGTAITLQWVANE